MAPTKRHAHPWKTQPRDAFGRFARGAATSPTSKIPGDCRNAGEVGAGVLSGRRSEPTAASGPSARPQRALQIPRRYAPTSTPSRSGDRPSNHGAGAELGGSGPTGTRRTSSTIGPPRASASALRIANAEPGTSRQPSRRGRFRRSSTVPISPSPGAYVTTKLSYINKGDGSGHKRATYCDWQSRKEMENYGDIERSENGVFTGRFKADGLKIKYQFTEESDGENEEDWSTSELKAMAENFRIAVRSKLLKKTRKKGIMNIK